MRDETAHEWGTRDGWATRQCDSEVACRGSYISGFQPLGFLFGLNLGLRPRLVYFAPLALGGNGAAVMGGRLAICLGLRRMVGGRVPGAKAPCFSVAGNARTEVRAYLRSKSNDWRECTPWVWWCGRFVVR
jgi:hypothetical protein